jgi:hypothetical protein
MEETELDIWGWQMGDPWHSISNSSLSGTSKFHWKLRVGLVFPGLKKNREELTFHCGECPREGTQTKGLWREGLGIVR